MHRSRIHQESDRSEGLQCLAAEGEPDWYLDGVDPSRQGCVCRWMGYVFFRTAKIPLDVNSRATIAPFSIADLIS